MLSSSLLLPLAISPFVAAGATPKEHCTTEYGSRSLGYVPRSTFTRTETCYDTLTTTLAPHTETVAPKPTTDYVGSTSTETVVVSSTGSTSTASVTPTSTVVSTSTETVSVQTATVTPMFYDSSDTANGKREEAERILHPPENRFQAREQNYTEKYPTAVVCEMGVERRLTKTVTHTAPTHTTTLGAKNVTGIHHHIRTVTSTTTLHPVVTVTASTSATATSTVVETSFAGSTTTTSWSTAAGPLPTICGQSNLFNGDTNPSASSTLINGFVDTGSAPVTPTADLTALECCLSCAQAEGCMGSAFNPQLAAGSQCAHVLVQGCSSATGQLGARFGVDGAEVDPNLGLIISNGYCGQWTGAQK